MVARVLLLDDDPLVVAIIKPTLDANGFQVTACDTIAKAKRLLGVYSFRLVLVDRVLGEEDGLDFVVHVRAHHPRVGIIVMSAKGAPLDRVVGIQTGADDYLSKPVNLDELCARAKRLSQRLTQTYLQFTNSDMLHFDGFVLDPVSRELRHCGQGVVEFTSTEFDLLHCLARAHNKPLTRRLLMETLHDRDPHTTERTIDNLIFRIRKKLGQHSATEVVKTMRGKGYSFGVLVIREPRAEGVLD